jgi:predicted nucleic acid-binding protein
MTGRWGTLTAPFSARIVGHQQVTDAYLLGLAIKEGGVLVTFDRGIDYLAGEEFSEHVLLLK